VQDRTKDEKNQENPGPAGVTTSAYFDELYLLTVSQAISVLPPKSHSQSHYITYYIT
jgi:hypothetical protein